MKNQNDDYQIKLSSGVENLMASFTPNQSVYSYLLVNKMIELHPEYGKGAINNVNLFETKILKSKDEWVEQVIDLYNWQVIDEFGKSDGNGILDGRKFMIGLALLDPDLRIQFDTTGVLDAIIDELKEPFPQILSKNGLNLYKSTFDSVPNQPDEPIFDINEDLLGRAAFARFLAKRIKSTEIGIGAYSIHLCGPWGSGKTTILNFLKSELLSADNQNSIKKSERKKISWTIVDFNAWRNQHIVPPWWPLYSQIYETSKKKLGFWYRKKEILWRLFTGQSFQLLVMIVVFWLIALAFSFLGTGKDPESWGTAAKNLSQIIALITTLAGAVVGFGRSLLFSSAKAAQSFQEYSHDPMKEIQQRFGKLVKRLNKKSRLAVFIDDLDRCKSNYVVALLEGIQTLFRQGSVFFIVAADRKWLQTCFELVYSEFKSTVGEPGRPLGTLFIEKTFQLATPVPSIPKDFKAAYWNQLIMVRAESIKKGIERVRTKAQNELEKGTTDLDVNDIVEQSRNQPMYEQLAIREEAVIRLASPEIVARTEHTLKPFISLLDDNPRAMKRLVNAYSVNRARAILAFLNISMEDLAQWTILNMRWPHLTEYLAEKPEMLGKIGGDNLEDVDEKVQYLFGDSEVINVVNGGDITTSLKMNVLKLCSKLL